MDCQTPYILAGEFELVEVAPIAGTEGPDDPRQGPYEDEEVVRVPHEQFQGHIRVAVVDDGPAAHLRPEKLCAVHGRIFTLLLCVVDLLL